MTVIDNVTIADLPEAVQHLGLPHTAHVRVVIETIPEKNEPNKWEKLQKRIHEYSPLRGLSGEIIKRSREFRDDFEFKHDSK